MPTGDNAVSEPISFPEWGDFKVGMLRNAAYMRVSRAADEFWRTKVETFFSIQGEELGEAQQLWGAMLQSCPEEQRPTSEEAEQWNQIAASTDMPIKFTETGQLVPT